MEIVIDSNTVAGYYKESVLEIPVGPNNNLTASVIPLFDGLGLTDVCYLDEGKIIENDWRGPVSEEWFDVWFARLLADGKAQLIPVSPCPLLERILLANGFPTRGGNDVWYVRLCRSVLEQLHLASIPLITEDLDFFDPRQKGCNAKTRMQILRSNTGPISRLLRRQNILVRAVCSHP